MARGLRGSLLAVLAATAFACGPFGSGPQPAPVASSPPVSATPVPSPPPSPPGYAVLQQSQPGSGKWDTVAVLGLDHQPLARTRFNPVTLPDVLRAANTLRFQPQARAIRGAVLFADGGGVIQRMGVDGKVTNVASLPLDAGQEMVFAASPAGDRIVVSVLTLPKTVAGPNGPMYAEPVQYRVDTYAVIAGQAPRQVQTQVYDEKSFFHGVVQGWTDAGAVAVDHFQAGTQGVLPSERVLGGPLRLFASDYSLGAPVGGQDCTLVADVVADGTVLCADGALTVRAANGTLSWQAKHQNALDPRLSPDGRMIAVDDGVLRSDGTQAFGPHTLAQDSKTPLFAQGWLDASHFFLQDAAHAGTLQLASEADPGHPTDTGVAGYFVGRV